MTTSVCFLLSLLFRTGRAPRLPLRPLFVGLGEGFSALISLSLYSPAAWCLSPLDLVPIPFPAVAQPPDTHAQENALCSTSRND